jgi:DNA-binding transcriptional LysR family regulator
MELRQLRYLVAVADEGSVTAAARAMLVAQPSLSQAVKALERSLGAPLLHRVGRGVVLTSTGEAVVAAARDALRAADAVPAAVTAASGLLVGRLDVVSLPTLAVDPLAPLLGELRRRHPPLTVRLVQPETTADLVELVRSGRCELGLTELTSPSRSAGAGDAPRSVHGLAALPLAHQELFATFPPDGAGGPSPGSRRTASLSQLAELPLVTSPVGTSTRHLIEAALADIGRAARVVVETDQREAIVPLVISGAGVAVLPTRQAEAAAAQGARVRPFRPPLRRLLGIVHRPAPLSPPAAAFMALAAEPRSS